MPFETQVLLEAAHAKRQLTLIMWVAGVLGESVKITKDKTKLSVSTDVPMSKRCAQLLHKL